MGPVMAAQFPGFTDADWLRYVRRTFQEAAGGGLELRYDPAISAALAAVDPAVPAPPLWPQFDALPQVPLMVIRGEHSDLLSRATVAEMRARRPDLEVVEVAGQGHAPMLTDWLDARSDRPLRGALRRLDRSGGTCADIGTKKNPGGFPPGLFWFRYPYRIRSSGGNGSTRSRCPRCHGCIRCDSAVPGTPTGVRHPVGSPCDPNRVRAIVLHLRVDEVEAEIEARDRRPDRADEALPQLEVRIRRKAVEVSR